MELIMNPKLPDAHCEVSTTWLQVVKSGIRFGLQFRFWAVK